MLEWLRRRVGRPERTRRFDAAAGTPRWNARPSFGPIGSEVLAASAPVRSRARYFVANNPWAANGVAALTTALVGAGITPAPLHPEESVRARITGTAREWSVTADADGLTDFPGLQSAMGRTMIIDGEAFAHLSVGDAGLQASGAGPIMAEDGKRLFHADHKNVAAVGTVFKDEYQNPALGLSGGRLALRNHKGLNGTSPINVQATYLLVGPTRATDADRFTMEMMPIAPTDVAAPWAKKLKVLVEPRIADKSWYLFSDPAKLAVVEYGYLSSAQGPQIASRDGWDVLGTEFRVTLDFGAGALDWRGAFRDPGVA